MRPEVAADTLARAEVLDAQTVDSLGVPTTKLDFADIEACATRSMMVTLEEPETGPFERTLLLMSSPLR